MFWRLHKEVVLYLSSNLVQLDFLGLVIRIYFSREKKKWSKRPKAKVSGNNVIEHNENNQICILLLILSNLQIYRVVLESF